MEKIKKFLNVIGKILYVALILSVILMCAFAVVQKTSNNQNSICGIKVFTVITGSMIPVYGIGDILVVKEVESEEIHVGDDIVYRGEKGSYHNKVITHRVVWIEKGEEENYRIVTKGVANTAQDPEINQTQVLGKVLFDVPIVNFILKIITNIYVWMLIPAVILIKKNIKRIRDMEEN